MMVMQMQMDVLDPSFLHDLGGDAVAVFMERRSYGSRLIEPTS